MSSASVNLSNESPASSVAPLPIPPPVEGAQNAAEFTLPLSPRTTATALAVLEMAPEDLRGLVYGLLQTLDRRDKAHAEELQEIQGRLQSAEESFGEVSARLAEYEASDEPERPDDFEPNEGKVTTLIPITEGFQVQAKWVRRRDDGQVDLLAGRDIDEDVYVAPLYASPTQVIDEPVETMPVWYHRLLVGPSEGYHDLVADTKKLDDWGLDAEVQRYRRHHERQRELQLEIERLEGERTLITHQLAAGQRRLEAAQAPGRVRRLERLGEWGNRKGKQLARRGRARYGLGSPF